MRVLRGSSCSPSDVSCSCVEYAESDSTVETWKGYDYKWCDKSESRPSFVDYYGTSTFCCKIQWEGDTCDDCDTEFMCPKGRQGGSSCTLGTCKESCLTAREKSDQKYILIIFSTVFVVVFGLILWRRCSRMAAGAAAAGAMAAPGPGTEVPPPRVQGEVEFNPVVLQATVVSRPS